MVNTEIEEREGCNVVIVRGMVVKVTKFSVYTEERISFVPYKRDMTVLNAEIYNRCDKGIPTMEFFIGMQNGTVILL